MRKERTDHVWVRTFEFMCAAIIGALASKLFDIYWPLQDLQSQLIVGIFIIISLLIVSLTFILIVLGLETAYERRRQRRERE